MATAWAALPPAVAALLARMTPEEKAGKLTLDAAAWAGGSATTLNPAGAGSDLETQLGEVRRGRLTGVFNGHGADMAERMQTAAMREARLPIPLIFGADVIHGFRTVFPVPLGEAASFDPSLAERTARAAAREAAAAGIDWTFAPMVDIARDARWGRGVEGAGEDVYLGRAMAAARVRGFQGASLRADDAVMACAKHLAAYGAGEGGLDYNAVDVSERTLSNVYFPPFEAALDAGAGSVMAAFNELSGLPAIGNRWLLTDVLRGEWSFGGVIVSDYTGDEEIHTDGGGTGSFQPWITRLRILGLFSPPIAQARGLRVTSSWKGLQAGRAALCRTSAGRGMALTLIGMFLGKLLTRGRLHLILADGTRESFGPGGAEEVTVRLHDKRVALDIARDPKLAFGEAYIDGRLTIEQGDIAQLLALALGNNRWEDGGGGRAALGGRRPGFKSLIMPLLKSLLRRNPPIKARQNVAHHYDLSDRLYELFLDRDRQYSCGYFTDPTDDLEQAQADKKAHIAAKLYLKPKQRVLDIGCGWGGTALYLNRVADVDVLGVTLSEEQLKVARRRAAEAGVADRVRFELVDYRSLTGTFDRIVSVGMFEHVGAAHYDKFFATCRDLLAPDGVMLLHTIGRLGAAALNPDPFITKYIFPGYHLPSLSQLCEASQKARLIASDVETLRLHYAYTLRHWVARTRAAKAEIVALYDERFYRLWEFYLAGAVMLFETGAGCNYQVQFIRDRHALPIKRDYMAEEERCYRVASIA